MTRLLRVVTSLLLLPFALIATAQTYPSKSVRMVVPFAAGAGSNDIMARLIAQKLTETFGQQVVVDNRPGASGIIGTDIVAKAQPDGYTLLMMSLTFSVNPSLFSKLPYDTIKDFIPVTMVASAPLMLVVHPSVPAKSVAEFIAYAKANPGKLNFGSGGPGTTPHLAGEMIKTMAGLQMTHIPYKGGAPALADLVGGQIQFMCENIPGTLPFAKSGKLRALAVTDLKRSPLLPELPTLDESGLRGYQIVGLERIVRPDRHAAGDRDQTAFRRRQRPCAAGRERATDYHGCGRRRRHAAAFRRVHQSGNSQVGAGRQSGRPQNRMTDVTRQLARFVVASRWTELPREVRHEAKRALLNWLGCALGGCNDPAVDTALAGAARIRGSAAGDRARPRASGSTYSTQRSSMRSARTCSTSTTRICARSSIRRCRWRPRLPHWPSMCPLRVRSFCTRLCWASKPNAGSASPYRPSITTPAGISRRRAAYSALAAACGKLLKLDEQQMTWALGIAATQAAGLTAVHGSMSKCFNMGHAARNGLTAALLAQKGYTSSERWHRSAARVRARAVAALRPERRRRRAGPPLGAAGERL